MNFYAFEYEKQVDFELINFEDTEYVQTIKNDSYYFLHQKLYGHNYPDDWSDEQKRETKTGVVGGLGQLKEQVFILIDFKENHIYSSLESDNKISRTIEEIINIKIPIFQRLVSIEEFETKISKLTGISIKPQSLKQKNFFTEDILNLNNQIIDLSEAEAFKLDITYNLSTNRRKIGEMYKQLVEKYNVGEVIFKGSNEDSLFQFNKESVIQKIPIKLSKNGEGNIFDYREVFQFLIQQL